MAAKILIVEDDKSLREIYGVRLQAEGYQVISANDGEQALAIAIKERPALIITDIMMPNITGFDMLDILRSTAETKDIRVIMMTALSSDDQRQRGERLGADRYLVKSQVGIEDVVRTVHEVLGDSPATTPPPAATAVTPSVPAAPAPAAAAVMPATTTPAPDMPSSMPAAPPPSQPIPATLPVPTVPPPVPSDTTLPVAQSSITPKPPSTNKLVLQPINDITAKVNINELLDRELAKEAGIDMLARPQVASTNQERALVHDQIAAVEQAPVAPQAPPPMPSLPPAPAPRPAPPAPTAPSRPSAPLQTPPRPPVVQ